MSRVASSTKVKSVSIAALLASEDRSQDISAWNSWVPIATEGQAWSTAGAASGSPNSRSASISIWPLKPTIPTCAKATPASNWIVCGRLGGAAHRSLFLARMI